MKSLFLAAALALCLAGSAQAAPAQGPTQTNDPAAAPLTLTLQQPARSSDQGFRDIVEVSGHRSALGVVASDALYGGLAGLAIGAGVALLNSDFNSGGNWGRDLAIGAGAGLIVGGIFGAVDVAASSDRYLSESNRAGRDRGFSGVGGMHSAF